MRAAASSRICLSSYTKMRCGSLEGALRPSECCSWCWGDRAATGTGVTRAENPNSGAKRRPHSLHQGLQRCRETRGMRAALSGHAVPAAPGCLGVTKAQCSTGLCHRHAFTLSQTLQGCDCSRSSSTPSSLARLADTTLTSPATVHSPPATSPPRCSHYLALARATHLLVPVYQPTLQLPTRSLEPHRSSISPSCPLPPPLHMTQKRTLALARHPTLL